MLKRDTKTLPLKSTCSQTDFHFEKHNLALSFVHPPLERMNITLLSIY